MESRPVLGNMIEYQRARLTALDNWSVVEATVSSHSDAAPAVADLLGVTEFGARSVVAMAHGPKPGRQEIESNLKYFEDVRSFLSPYR